MAPSVVTLPRGVTLSALTDLERKQLDTVWELISSGAGVTERKLFVKDLEKVIMDVTHEAPPVWMLHRILASMDPARWRYSTLKDPILRIQT
jgi:hypothetical protein